MTVPPELIDDIAAEIFLRLPPDEPEHLFRASLVCKPWLRVISDPGFLRRYRAFHRTPPLLGFLQRRQVLGGDPDHRITPTTAVPLPDPSFRDAEALDCRHGRVLFSGDPGDGDWCFIVWDPLTSEKQCLPEVDIDLLIYSVAVFCAVSGCDHHDCHGCPFRVVLVATTESKLLIKACSYSSETGAWSKPVTLGNDCEVYAQYLQDASESRTNSIPYVQPRRGAVIGDETYFTLRWANAIVRYNWTKNCISMIQPPTRDVYYIALMEMEDSALGFVCIEESRLYLWSRKPSLEAAAEWVKCRVIKLEGLLHVAVSDPDDEALVVGSAEGVGAIFVTTGAGLFTFELKSGRVRKVDEPEVYFSVIPYMSFYTPEITKDGHRTLSSLARLRTL
ncbi:hypothetical protein EJB05_14334 [Eragrostis curvula]|uniref:Uncharacterized protein n=1 Tax=Eragrostis curvula TaxID=38414 RepID=A0A5J9VZZ5_9POAL|nr:hypothetical protein EJB05_14334 [Eragrostis curvula]